MSGTAINWDSADLLRLVGDLTGDGNADIVGFGPDGVWVSLNNGDGTFRQPRRANIGFGVNQGWTTAEHPRFLADLNGDGKADILGFGDDGVWIALNNGDGSFAPARYVLANFGFNQGWRVESHPRFLADLTGDKKPDIVAFGDAGVWTALNNGDGTFADARFVIGDLGASKGWRVDAHPRFLADVTGDGKTDIVAFGDTGVWTAISNGDGSFAGPNFVLANLGVSQGWAVDKHVRLMADLTGDGKADIVAFGDAGVWTAISNGDGSFAGPNFVLANLGVSQGWAVDKHVRLMADLTGDGKADIVAFGNDGVWTAVSNGDGSFAGANYVLANLGVNQGWAVDKHVRLMADLTGDGKADIVGFGDAGVWIAISQGSGTLAAAQFVLEDFGARSGIKTRTISLDYLQRKFDTFFKNRQRPLIKVGLDNPDRTFGQFTITVYFDENNSGVPQYQTAYSHLVTDFTVSEIGDNRAYIQDLNTDGVTLNISSRQPLVLEAAVHFETGGGVEIKVEGSLEHDIDIETLSITLRPEVTLGRNIPAVYSSGSLKDYLAKNPNVAANADLTGRLDLFGWIEEIEAAVNSATTQAAITIGPSTSKITSKTTFRGETVTAEGLDEDGARGNLRTALVSRFIPVDAKVNVQGFADDGASGTTAQKFGAMICNALNPNSGDPGGAIGARDKISRNLTTWLVGVDCVNDADARPVLSLSSDAENLTLEYVVPPGQLSPFPESPQPPLDPGPLANIHNIVVLMMENRSFDHMLGHLSLDPSAGGKGRSDVDGLGPAAAIPNALGNQSFTPFRITDPSYVHYSPPHEHDYVLGQINGGQMNGFVREYAGEYNLEGAAASDVMGYYDGTVLTVYEALASNFLVCDRWFAAHPGPTFCNRFYMVTGRLNRDPDGNQEFDNFSGDKFVPVTTKTVFDHLSDRGVTWRFYENRYCTLRLYANYAFDDVNIVDYNDPVKGFAAAAAAGTLPSVTFIDPNFIDEPDAGDNDDAAPGNVAAGQALIGDIVHALTSGPQWSNILFLIVYDEHGGFFDHVSPLKPENRANAVPVSGIDFYGVRVPSIVVSPWVAPGQASHVVFDHTSIIKTISRCFMSADPPDMGERVAAANDLSAVIQSAAQTDRPPIPVLAATQAQGSAAARTVTPDTSPASTDFKDVMRYLSQRQQVTRAALAQAKAASPNANA